MAKKQTKKSEQKADLTEVVSKTCPECFGRGLVNEQSLCLACNGSGLITE